MLAVLGLILNDEYVHRETFNKFVGDRRLSDVQRDLAWLKDLEASI
jgi:hypothetical protein